MRLDMTLMLPVLFRLGVGGRGESRRPSTGVANDWTPVPVLVTLMSPLLVMPLAMSAAS